MSLDLSCVTTHFFPNTLPYGINKGDCYIWAWLASRYIQGSSNTGLCTAEDEKGGIYILSHAYLRVGTLYYDAECPRGVVRPESLPFFGYTPGDWDHYEESRQAFKARWSDEDRPWPSGVREWCGKVRLSHDAAGQQGTAG